MDNIVLLEYAATLSGLQSTNPVLNAEQVVFVKSITNAVKEPRKKGNGSTAFNSLPFIDTLQIETDTAYDLTQSFLAVNGNEIEITNIGSSAIVITTDGDPVNLGVGETGKYRRISGSWLATAATGGGAGLPNYLGIAAGNWTADTGVAVDGNAVDPLKEDGDIKITFDNATMVGDAGAYQDITLNEIDLNSLLQFKMYFKVFFGDLTALSFKVLSQDESTEYASYSIEDEAEYNSASGVYSLNVIFNTTDEADIRVKLESDDSAATVIQIADVSLGAPFYYTAPSNRDDAGTLYIDYEAPTSGVNRMDDLVMDGSTVYQFAKYPQILAKKAELDGVFITDNGDGTFNTVDLGDRFLKMKNSTDSVGDLIANAIEDHDHRINAGKGSHRHDAIAKFIYNGGGVGLGSGAYQYIGAVTYSNNATLPQIDTDSVLNANVQTKTYPDHIAVYFYLKTKSTASIVMAQISKGAGYDYPLPLAVQDISAATGSDKTTDLSIYESGGSLQQRAGFMVHVTWKDGDATYAHKFTSGGLFYNQFMPNGLAPGDNSSTFAWCGYGTGGLTLKLKENLVDWDVQTEGCFDRYTSGTQKIKKTVDKEIRLIHTDTESVDTDVASGSVYRTASLLSAITFVEEFGTLDDSRVQVDGSVQWVAIGSFGSTTTGTTFYVMRSASDTGRTIRRRETYIGEWRD